MARPKDGTGARKHNRWNAVTLERRQSIVEHAAIAVVERHHDSSRRQRARSCPRGAKIIERNRVARFCEQLAVALEGVAGDMQLVEGRRFVGPADAVIAEHGNARKGHVRQAPAVVAHREQRLLDRA